MRPFLLLLCCFLPGCEAAAVMLGIDMGSVAVFGRSVGDIVVSGVTGRDCSIVRLDKGQTYCADPFVQGREAYCTRSLATVDCWAHPPPGQRLVADTPHATAAQERYRAAPWPKSFALGP